ncbi:MULTISPECIES: helix-turn-helix domain-containing protein [Flavobacteriaceae]|jgi:YesN/AraC family two-component response regulator|uniref:AraC family transcriptional regulator n=2 Tax=Flavobacteriaceae TaxID=49546 RepID=A0ABU7IYH7_9FLAO|nr:MULTISPECIES: helix-turn-helix domain-containing protein [Flavobacteriaceae]MDC6390655.1 AraC family transcriptional regulator [Maribacter sp. PR1]MEE1978047.1 AraC family transcriptional regulator [Maribacter cobaltidurans]RIV47246.1 AraC family transcriptional regulator [Allomuricauda maritima]TXK00948.1 helix-turn-helix domain-containing protein [Allomuricauda maritima]
MDLILPYINPVKFRNALIANYGFSNQEAWNSNLLSMPKELGKGSLHLFIRNDIHFFRGKWSFKEETLFYSDDPVGKKGFVDFRIGANGEIQSCAIENREKFEFETTKVDGMRIFIPEKFLPAAKNKVHSQFEKYCLDSNIIKLLENVFSIDHEDTRNIMLLESKILEFVHFWSEFLCRKEIDQHFEGVNDHQLNCVKIALHILNEDLSKTMTIKELSRKSGINECDLKKCFRTVTGLPVRKFIIKRRMEKAKQMIDSTDLPIYEICQEIGYSNRHYFASLYKKFHGMNPSEDRVCKGLFGS